MGRGWGRSPRLMGGGGRGLVPRSDVGGTLSCDLFHDALDATYRPPPKSAWHVLTAYTHCSGRSRGGPPRPKFS